MITHVVMFKLKDFALGSVKEENLKKLKNRLEGLVPLIPEIKFYEVGLNVIPSDRAYDAVLISKFEDIENLDKYKQNPNHLELVDFILEITENRIAVDY